MSELQLDLIRTDGGTQPRAQINFLTVEEYVEAMEDGAHFPAVDVIYDGSDYWLVDGFHRIAAAKKAGLVEFDTNVTQGTLQDAQWASYGVNATHGLRRSNEDKRRAVEAALKHPKAATLSDNQIASHCGVSQPFVSKLRPSYNDYKIEEKVVTRNGSTYTMNTANIGQSSEPNTQQPPLPEVRNGEEVCDDGLTDGEWVDQQMDELKKKLPPVAPPPPKPYAPQHSTAASGATFESEAPTAPVAAPPPPTPAPPPPPVPAPTIGAPMMRLTLNIRQDLATPVMIVADQGGETKTEVVADQHAIGARVQAVVDEWLALESEQLAEWLD